MKKILLPAIFILLFVSNKMFAQDMTPPQPIDLPILTSMTGDWVSEPYQFMGMTMTDEINVKMVYNSQFLQVDIRSVGSSGFVYEGVTFIAPSKDGTLTGWCYDIFGKEGITSYTGTWKDNMMYMYGTSSWGTESRVLNVNGNVLTSNVILNMKDDSGKKIPEQTMTISFNKK
jgi:hypothetical protein